MAGVTLSNGTYVYSQETALDYLRSCGIDNKEDMATIFYLAEGFDIQDVQDFLNGEYVRKDEIDDYECVADGYLQAYNDLCASVNDALDRFVNSRTKTKAQFASWLKNEMEDALYEY